MAKIKVKFNANEIEIDSRDFYLDNDTVGEIIKSLSKYMNTAAPSEGVELSASSTKHGGLDSLEEAEVFEPEFNDPKPIEADQIRSKLSQLEAGKFFDSPRTVSETVEQLRENGWSASSLDVSKALAKMATSREISKNSEDERAYYISNPVLTT
ncbi:MAG: hypothetical protein OXC46_06260 [Thaumarchaeota archaeon]|nr:hypothetical protein [Nitrososphaerota archaeon]